MSAKDLRPEIIDNSKPTAADVINLNLKEQRNHIKFIDISTGYFSVEGYMLLSQELDEALRQTDFKMRLLMGEDSIRLPKLEYADYKRAYMESGVLPVYDDMSEIKLEGSEHVNKATSDLIRLLKRNNVEIRHNKRKFNHSKCYILGDEGVLIGSSNFTKQGLESNDELNAGVYNPASTELARDWFNRMWNSATDAKTDLITALEESKFGAPPTPYLIYIKILFEMYRNIVVKDGSGDTSISEYLTEFQSDAVRQALHVISQYGGVIIADATGLGKTDIGIEILRQKILKEGKKAMIVAPHQVLHGMWEERISGKIPISEMRTAEEMSRDSTLDQIYRYKNIDLILIDESQNFKNEKSNRHANLSKILIHGKPKEIVLLSATPINNTLLDLYSQLSIITKNDDSYFYSKIGIRNLRDHINNAVKSGGLKNALPKIQMLLDQIMIRRTRSYIMKTYPNAKINDSKVQFPEHQYEQISYSLSKLYGPEIFKGIAEGMKSLTMAPYGIESYNTKLTDEERHKRRITAGLQTMLILKRFESSVEAVKTSLVNKIRVYKYVLKVLEQGKIMKPSDYHREMDKIMMDDVPDDILTEVADDMDPLESAWEKEFEKRMKNIPLVDAEGYDIQSMKTDVKNDQKILESMLKETKKVTIDDKFDAVRNTIVKDGALEKESKKVLIFTEYRTTAKYLEQKLKETFASDNMDETQRKIILRVDGTIKKDSRQKYLKQFAPRSNMTEVETDRMEHNKEKLKEADILISTEVLAEGQNLQDCNYVINYDLPWNPMRIVQRTGRIDRLTSQYDIVRTRACLPDKDLDDIMKLWGRLVKKIEDTNVVLGLDANVLDVEANPMTWGSTEERIRGLAGEGAAKIIKTLEGESDMDVQESPINVLMRHLNDIATEEMDHMALGRRSGKRTGNIQMEKNNILFSTANKAVLAYLEKCNKKRNMRFVIYDYATHKAYVPSHESDALEIIACDVDTERHLPMDTTNEYKESFSELLRIDNMARDAIDKYKKKIKYEIQQDVNVAKGAYQKVKANIRDVITQSTLDSKLQPEKMQKIIEILETNVSKPYYKQFKECYDAYMRPEYRNVDELVQGVERIGEMISYKSTENIEENEENTEIILVGAMFVTEDGFVLNHDIG